MTNSKQEMLTKLNRQIELLDDYTTSLPGRGATIFNMIEYAYGRYLSESLRTCFNNHGGSEDILAKNLTTIFEQHWNWVRGSFLCYTSTPDSACSIVLLELANWVCHYNQSIGRVTSLLELVMPSIKLISTTRSALDLVVYRAEDSEMVPGAIADFNGQIKAVTDITEFKQLLYTHCLTADGESLFPIALLLEVTLAPEKRPLIKPYIPTAKEQDPSFQEIVTDPKAPCNQTPDSEFNRLCEHTELTKAVMKAKAEYEHALSLNQESLKSALDKFAVGLFAGSSHGGKGKSTEANEEAYAALGVFMEYYHQLSPSIKNGLPKDLVTEIDRIILLGSNKDVNTISKLTVETKTCVGLMGEKIRYISRTYESILNKTTMGLNNPQVLELIKNKKLAFSARQIKLKEALEAKNTPNSYASLAKRENQLVDKFGVTLPAVQHLGVDFIFATCPHILDRAVPKPLSVFKELMNPLPIDTQAFFYQNMTAYWPKIIHNISDCIDILAFAQARDKSLIPHLLAALSERWTHIVFTLKDFSQIARYFGEIKAGSESIQNLFGVIRPKLKTLIRNVSDYQDVINYLSRSDQLSFLSDIEKDKHQLWAEILTNPTNEDRKETLLRSIDKYLNDDLKLKNKLDALFDNTLDRLAVNQWNLKPDDNIVVLAKDVDFFERRAPAMRDKEYTRKPELDRSEYWSRFSKQDRFGYLHTYWKFDIDGWMKSKFKSDKKLAFTKEKYSKVRAFYEAELGKTDYYPLLHALFEAHPWLREDPNGPLVLNFLKYIINKHLIQDTNNNLASMQTQDILKLSVQNFSWKPLNWFDNFAQYYPYLDVKFFQKNLPNLPSFESGPDRSWAEAMNLGFSRLDVLRYLGYCHPKKMTVTSDNNGEVSRSQPIKVVMLSDFKRLPQNSRAETDFFVINIASENQPFWLGLQCGNQPILYCPNYTETELFVLIRVIGDEKEKVDVAFNYLSEIFIGLTRKSISYKHNLALNDFNGDITLQTIWHTILFTRILGRALMSDPLTLHEHVPLYLLMQLFYKKNYGANVVSNSSRALHNLEMRHPYSSLTVVDSPINLGDLPADQLCENLNTRISLYSRTATSDEFISSLLHLKCEPRADGNYKLIYTKPARLSLNSLNVHDLYFILTVLHHSPLIREVVFFENYQFNIENKDTAIVKALLDTNPNLLNIHFSGSLDVGKYFEHYFKCIAARNRFLAFQQPSLMNIETSLQTRIKLWNTAGRQLLNYFQTEELRFDDKNENKQAFMENWRTMGIVGVKHLFDAIALSPGQAPSLDITFDLGAVKDLDPPIGPETAVWGGRHLYNSPNIYHARLSFTCRLKDYLVSYRGEGPLFRSVSLILPPVKQMQGTQDQKNQQLGRELTTFMNELKKHFDPTETHPHAISLYLSNDVIDATAEKMILYRAISFIINIFNSLRKSDAPTTQQGAKKEVHNYLIPHFPLLENEAEYQKLFLGGIRDDYHQVQNACLASWREFNCQVPDKAMKGTFSLLLAQRLRPEIMLTDLHEQASELDWGDEESPLVEDLSTQVQMQQEQQLQATTTYQVTPPPPEEKPPILVEEITLIYNKYTEVLISRENINEDPRFKAWWDTLSKETKIQYGGSGQALFNALFGRKKAMYAIDQVEFCALKRLFPHIPQLLGGFDRDNRIAGFSLALGKPNMRIKINGKNLRYIILTFDAKKEKEDIAEYLALPPGQRNPYTLCLTTLPHVNYFFGDQRQFANLSTESSEQQILYQFLASVDPKRSLTTGESETQLVDQNIDFSYKLCLKVLKRRCNNPALDCLFEPSDEACLTPQNLKSLGQLFYQFDSAGLAHFFSVADAIIQQDHFGKQGLINWKKGILDNNPNWSTCLDQAELEAVSLSISTLKGHSRAQEIWWLLVDKHAKTVGFTTYRSIWYAYQKCLGYIIARQLIVDVDAFRRVVNGIERFNAQIFLQKLHVLLHTNANTLNGRELSQQLLKDLEPADVDFYGQLYAILYENYPYNHPKLKLTDLTTTSNSLIPTYVVSWPNQVQVTDPITHALRYACLRGRLYFDELSQLARDLENHFSEPLQKPAGVQLLRLYIGCVTGGINFVGSLSPIPDGLLTIDLDILRFINQGMTLSDDVQKNSIELDWQDILTLAEAIDEIGLLALDEVDPKAFIRACGRAMRCYRSQHADDDNLLKLINIIKEYAFKISEQTDEDDYPDGMEYKRSSPEEDGQQTLVPDWNHPLLNDYPWLILTQDEPSSLVRSLSALDERMNDQTTMFVKQLRTIRFEKNRYFPNLERLQGAFEDIANSGDPEGARRQVVSAWEGQGFSITLRDTKYNPLSEEELAHAMLYLDNHLEPNFKMDNLGPCKRLFQDYLALPTIGLRRKEMDELLEVCCKQLDNKKHYNELGRIIDDLFQLAKASDETQSKKYYSVKHLTEILKLMINQKLYKTHHYPLNLLKIILTSPIADKIISSDLNQLDQGPDKYFSSFIFGLVDNIELSSDAREIAVTYATRGNEESHRENAEYAKTLLTELFGNDPKLEPSYIDMVYQLLKNYELTTSEAYLTWQRKHVEPFRVITDANMRSCWQEMQIKWQKQLPGSIQDLFPVLGENPSQIQLYRQMILVQVLSANEIEMDAETILRPKLIAVGTHLIDFTPQELEQLIKYSFSDSRLTLDALYVLFTQFNSLFQHTEQALNGEFAGSLIAPPVFNNRQANQVIHFFESAYISRGKFPRNYSISDKERDELFRVLDGMKSKNEGFLSLEEKTQLIGFFYYCNTFAVGENLQLDDVDKLASLARQCVKRLTAISADDKTRPYLKMQVLACIREIYFKKTKPIWTNHKQMIVLIYLAIHSDETGLIQKIATGEGKSVITPQRAIYLAFFGKTVDIVSAKEILSERDNKRDANLMKACGFPVSHHITPKSSIQDYERTDSQGGSIHYFNLGNFALFICDVVIARGGSFNLSPNNRVAVLDEADYLLLFEIMLQYNYAKQQAGGGLYNYDEWVFRAVCEYYSKNRDSFRLDQDSGQLFVSNKAHLRPLFKSLQALAITAPEQSQFIKKTMIPAINGDNKDMQELIRVLRKHLSSCHNAYSLIKDKTFYMGTADRQVGDIKFTIRFPYVMIANQAKPDSIYCNGTHQYLQMRLKLEAADKGEPLDIFVDPVSEIVVSLSPESILKNLFARREGSTGTPGGDLERLRYRLVHQIEDVIKFPRYQLPDSTRLPTVFTNKEGTIAKIAELIIAHPERPFLIDCESDADVKELSAALVTCIKKSDPQFDFKTRFIVDTLDKEKDETYFIGLAGKNGTCLFSARVGRGTDIECKNPEGLFVIETAAVKPKITRKQLWGRQGRHGQKGTVVAVFDVDDIKKRYDNLMSNDPHQEFSRVDPACRTKLDSKINQHRADQSPYWQELLNNPDYKEQFAVTEAVATFFYQKELFKFFNGAESNNIISDLGLLFVLPRLCNLNGEMNNARSIDDILQSSAILIPKLKELWRTTHSVLGENNHDQFIDKLPDLWEEFCDTAGLSSQEDNDFIYDFIASLLNTNRPTGSEVNPTPRPKAEMPPVTKTFGKIMAFLVKRIPESFNDYTRDKNHTKFILDDHGSFQVLNNEKPPYFSHLVGYIDDLQSLMRDASHSKEIESLFEVIVELINENSFFAVDVKTHRYILAKYQELISQPINEAEAAASSPQARDTKAATLWLTGLSAFFKQPLLGNKPAGLRPEKELDFMSQLAELIVGTFSKKYCYNESTSNPDLDPSIVFIKALSQKLADRFLNFDSNRIKRTISRLRLLLTTDKDVTTTLTRQLIHAGRLNYIVNIIIEDNHPSNFDGRLRTLCTRYLKSRQLEDYPNMTSNLFDLYFKNNEGGKIPPLDLPEICPPAFNENEKVSIQYFWLLLAKHAPTTKAERDALITALRNYTEEADREKLLNILIQIPEPVSLLRINKLIKQPNPADIQATFDRLNLFIKQSMPWFDLLKSKDLVHFNGSYWRPNRQLEAEYIKICSVFNEQLKPADSEFFFNHDILKWFTVDEIECFSTGFINGSSKLERQELEPLFKLFEDIKKSSAPFRTALEDIFKTALKKNAKLLYFNREKLKYFLDKLADLPVESPITNQTIADLWNKWQGDQIPNISDLQRVVNLLKTVQAHQTTPQTLNSFFDLHASDDIVQERIFLMQCLNQNVVEFEPTVKSRYQAKFEQYFKNHVVLGAREPGYIGKVFYLTNQLFLMTQSLFQKNGQNRYTQANLPTYHVESGLKSVITKAKKSYNRCFFQSDARAREAKDLFESIQADQVDIDWVLDKILHTKNSISRGAGIKSNYSLLGRGPIDTKGYSRLNEITSILLAEVIVVYMDQIQRKDQPDSFKEQHRVRLYQKLEGYYRNQIADLIWKLSSLEDCDSLSNILKEVDQELMDNHQITPEKSKALRGLIEKNKSRVPSYLRYILDELLVLPSLVNGPVGGQNTVNFRH